MSFSVAPELWTLPVKTDPSTGYWGKIEDPGPIAGTTYLVWHPLESRLKIRRKLISTLLHSADTKCQDLVFTLLWTDREEMSRGASRRNSHGIAKEAGRHRSLVSGTTTSSGESSSLITRENHTGKLVLLKGLYAVLFRAALWLLSHVRWGPCRCPFIRRRIP